MAEELESQGETCGRSKAGTLMNMAEDIGKTKKNYKRKQTANIIFLLLPICLTGSFG